VTPRRRRAAVPSLLGSPAQPFTPPPRRSPCFPSCGRSAIWPRRHAGPLPRQANTQVSVRVSQCSESSWSRTALQLHEHEYPGTGVPWLAARCRHQPCPRPSMPSPWRSLRISSMGRSAKWPRTSIALDRHPGQPQPPATFGVDRKGGDAPSPAYRFAGRLRRPTLPIPLLAHAGADDQGIDGQCFHKWSMWRIHCICCG
jgi:hypothetical protein